MTTKQSTVQVDLPTGEQLYETLRTGLQALITPLERESVHLVGIHSGGAWLAQRLHDEYRPDEVVIIFVPSGLNTRP